MCVYLLAYVCVCVPCSVCFLCTHKPNISCKIYLLFTRRQLSTTQREFVLSIINASALRENMYIVIDWNDFKHGLSNEIKTIHIVVSIRMWRICIFFLFFFTIFSFSVPCCYWWIVLALSWCFRLHNLAFWFLLFFLPLCLFLLLLLLLLVHVCVCECFFSVFCGFLLS